MKEETKEVKNAETTGKGPSRSTAVRQSKPAETILPHRYLTVLIRDDSPLIFCNDSPSFRSVKIRLTDEQLDLIKLNYTGSSCVEPVYESLSKCFIEEE